MADRSYSAPKGKLNKGVSGITPEAPGIIHTTLRKIVRSRGIEVYRNYVIVYGLLSDLAPEAGDDLKKVRLALFAGAGDRFCSLVLNGSPAAGREPGAGMISGRKRIMRNYLEDCGFKESFAEYIAELLEYSVEGYEGASGESLAEPDLASEPDSGFDSASGVSGRERRGSIENREDAQDEAEQTDTRSKQELEELVAKKKATVKSIEDSIDTVADSPVFNKYQKQNFITSLTFMRDKHLSELRELQIQLKKMK